MTLTARLASLGLGLTLPMATIVAQGSPTFGVLGGITSSNITVSGEGISLSLESRTGIAAGVSLRFPLSAMAELEIDALYAEKGTKISDGEDSAELKLSYVDVPVLIRYNIGTAEAKPFILAGGSLGFKSSCSIGATTGSVSASSECIDVIEDEQKAIDLGVTFGGGVAFNRFSVQARYTLGLTEINDDGDDTITTKNKALFLLAGISF